MRLARDMVRALDQILLMAAAPAERVGSDVLLTLQEMRAAKAIPPSGSVSMSTLASSTGVSLPTATHIVNRLGDEGRCGPDQDGTGPAAVLGRSQRAVESASSDVLRESRRTDP